MKYLLILALALVGYVHAIDIPEKANEKEIFHLYAQEIQVKLYEGNTQKALEACNTLLRNELSPLLNASARLLRGLVYDKLGNQRRAERDVMAAIEVIGPYRKEIHSSLFASEKEYYQATTQSLLEQAEFYRTGILQAFLERSGNEG